MTEPTAFCPECRQGEILDPRTEYLDWCGAHGHRAPALTGSADGLVALPWPEVLETETAEQTRAACAAIHRPCSSPSA